jgi:hypothetical protein
MRARRTHAPTCCVRVRARVCVCDRAHTHPRRHMRAPFIGMDRVWLCSQAFDSASAFNANIGAWNTARVTTLAYVCAGFWARRRATAAGRARRVVGAARAVVRCGAADARSRVSGLTCGHVHARASTCVGIAARSNDGICDCMYGCVCMYVYVGSIHIYLGICELV